MNMSGGMLSPSHHLMVTFQNTLHAYLTKLRNELIEEHKSLVGTKYL